MNEPFTKVCSCCLVKRTTSGDAGCGCWIFSNLYGAEGCLSHGLADPRSFCCRLSSCRSSACACRDWQLQSQKIIRKHLKIVETSGCYVTFTLWNPKMSFGLFGRLCALWSTSKRHLIHYVISCCDVAVTKTCGRHLSRHFRWGSAAVFPSYPCGQTQRYPWLKWEQLHNIFAVNASCSMCPSRPTKFIIYKYVYI